MDKTEKRFANVSITMGLIPFEVLLSDPSDVTMSNIMCWLLENNIKHTFEVVDVSDVSGQYDTIVSFQFTNEQDQLLFALKWT